MQNRRALAVAALLILVVGVPIAYRVVWDAPQLSRNIKFLLLVGPALVSFLVAGLAVIPGKSRIGSDRGEWLGVMVGSLSLVALAVGIGFVALSSAI